MKPIRLVSATRGTREEFHASSPLGVSLAKFMEGFGHRTVVGDAYYRGFEVQLLLFDENKRGLPAVYNQAIEDARDSPATLVFVHDDVWLVDLFWVDRLVEAMKRFDVVGLAGSQRRHEGQVTWCHIPRRGDAPPELDILYLSGTVGNGVGAPCEQVSIYGPAGLECKLLDGVFLAADSEALIGLDVWFDERFTFDFYDLDFCRQATSHGMKLGTWPISVMHHGSGRPGFGTQGWVDAAGRYLDKYREA